MLIRFVCHLSIPLADEHVMQLQEQRIPGRIEAALKEKLGDSFEVVIGDDIPSQTVAVGKVQWRGDHLLKAFGEVRDAVAEARVRELDHSEIHASIVPQRYGRPDL